MNSNAIRSDWVGQVVEGRFPLLAWRGGGDGSFVFLTEWEGREGQKAVIKLIPGDHDAVEERLAGWAAAARLSHPHLMGVFHSGRASIEGVEMAYAVMECADEILGEIIAERPLEPGEAREMFAPVLDALAYLHGEGFVHGHLKPSNIMAVEDRLKLAGDDLQRAGEGGHGAAEQGIHAAPETALGTISPAADLWSLGVTVVEVLTQHPPAFDARAKGDPIVPDSVPEPFSAMARACLRREPAERATLGDLKAMLEGKAAARKEPVGPTRQTAVNQAEGEAARGEGEREGDASFEVGKMGPGKRRVMTLVALLVVVAAAVAIFAALSHKAPRGAPSGSEAQAPAAAEQGTQPESEPGKGTPGSQSLNRASQSPEGVTEKGAVAGRVMPDVPAKASGTIEGKVQVEVRVEVDPEGRVSNADFASRGVSRYFANLALEAARRWRFAPARAGGQAVRSEWVLRFVFRQSGTDVSARETSP